MPPICAAIESPSLSLNDGALAPLPPGPMRWPGRTCSRLVPRPAIWFCTASVAPLPTVTMVITALTPMTMPRTVRKERSRLRRIERSDNSRVLSHMGDLPLKSLVVGWAPPACSATGCRLRSSLATTPSTKRTMRLA